MKEYEYNERHSRVTFSARDVLNIRPVLAKLSNTHPTFLAIRQAFDAETVNISSKQAEVLNRALSFDGQPNLTALAARNPFAGLMQYRGSPEAAVRVIMAHLECGSYGDWTYSTDFADLSGGMQVLEVRASDTVFVAFSDARDLDTAMIALETPGWLM